MTDVHDKETRSFTMSRIRSRDTRPEILSKAVKRDVVENSELHFKSDKFQQRYIRQHRDLNVIYSFLRFSGPLF
ncbi:MAG: hypothetical protein AB1487_04980 [Thermodesulfobacteriota bacterium]